MLPTLHLVAVGMEEASRMGGTLHGVMRLWPNCGSSSPEMRPASLGRAAETMEVPSAEVEGPQGGKVYSFIVLTFS